MLVCVDPGHGGHDSGAIGALGTREADVVLPIALSVTESLGWYPGCRAVITRDVDETLSLGTRCEIANAINADLFLSIHANAATDRDVGGVETYSHRRGSPLAHDAAELIQQRLVIITKLRDRGAKRADFYVLRHTTPPAVLAEVGFLSNPHEEQLLLNDEWRRYAATAIAAGVVRWATESGHLT